MCVLIKHWAGRFGRFMDDSISYNSLGNINMTIRTIIYSFNLMLSKKEKKGEEREFKVNKEKIVQIVQSSRRRDKNV